MKLVIPKYSSSSIMFIFVYIFSILNMGNPLVLGSLKSVLSMHFIFLIAFFYSSLMILANKVVKRQLLSAYMAFNLFILPSVFLSDFLDVSIIKFLSFTIGLFSLIYLSNDVFVSGIKNKLLTYKAFRNINRGVLVASALVYILGKGYTVNETGFAGFLNHPQVFGVFLVLVILTELYGINMKVNSIRLSTVAILVALIYSLMTESRLSIISSFILIFSYALAFLKLKKSYVIISLILISITSLMVDKIDNKIDYILSKSGRVETSGFEALEKSRGFLVTASLKNFKDNPAFGIGFQTSNGKYGSYEMVVIRDPILGLPVKASVEKGVFWTALLEEVGVFGFFGFFMLILSYYKKFHNKIGKLIIATFLLLGCGESFFFALGGMGSFVWCIFFLLYTVRDLTLEK